jgi:2-iminobutanoate/2-iminopropanoate deaminase
MASPAASRWLHTSGIIGTHADGTIPPDLAGQAEVIWASLTSLLHADNMDVTHIVSCTTYVVVGQDLSVVMAARDQAMAGHRAASTLLTVPALARPEWLMEIAIIAAAPPAVLSPADGAVS